ncbi:hypothetical protein LOKO_01609 [Halomonas chromatireducens]|uniref:Uncharacterized protein n=1 Tax=Halomonas chromatireducens TaxID=507626 RepID=A0A0X8HDL7_9GAMM|nr:hypothetical protein LOKO_01609 [Halomonas chromatireducens]
MCDASLRSLGGDRRWRYFQAVPLSLFLASAMPYSEPLLQRCHAALGASSDCDWRPKDSRRCCPTLAITANVAASAEAPGGASRDGDQRSNSCFVQPWQAITTLLEYLQITTGGRRTPGGVARRWRSLPMWRPPPRCLVAPVAMETSAPTAVAMAGDYHPVGVSSDHDWRPKDSRRCCPTLAITANGGASAEVPGGASRDAESERRTERSHHDTFHRRCYAAVGVSRPIILGSRAGHR